MSTGTAADDQFYREYILDHYKNPRNYGRLENPDITHEEDNPLCGDVIGMDFRLKDGVIEDIRFHGRDERLRVQSFYEGQAFLYQVVKMLSKAEPDARSSDK